MTPIHDLVVGVLSIVVGCLLIGGAAVDSPVLLSLAKSRLLAEAVGRTKARWIIAGVGAASIVLGALVASGWRIRW